MDVGVGILFLAVLLAEMMLLRVWAAAISISGIRRLPVTFIDSTIEQLDLENMGVAVEILCVGVLELKITLGGYLAPISIMCM